MKDARFTIPTPALLAKVVDLLDARPMEDRDTKGDLYEYMLGKAAMGPSLGWKWGMPPKMPPTRAGIRAIPPDNVRQKKAESADLSATSGLSRPSLDMCMVEVGGIEPPSEGTPSPALHA